MKKRHKEGEKHITPVDFAEHLRKSHVSDNSKVYYGRLPQNGLHESYFCISKCRLDLQYLDVC